MSEILARRNTLLAITTAIAIGAVGCGSGTSERVVQSSEAPLTTQANPSVSRLPDVEWSVPEPTQNTRPVLECEPIYAERWQRIDLGYARIMENLLGISHKRAVNAKIGNMYCGTTLDSTEDIYRRANVAGIGKECLVLMVASLMPTSNPNGAPVAQGVIGGCPESED